MINDFTLFFNKHPVWNLYWVSVILVTWDSYNTDKLVHNSIFRENPDFIEHSTRFLSFLHNFLNCVHEIKYLFAQALHNHWHIFPVLLKPAVTSITRHCVSACKLNGHLFSLILPMAIVKLKIKLRVLHH